MTIDQAAKPLGTLTRKERWLFTATSYLCWLAVNMVGGQRVMG